MSKGIVEMDDEPDIAEEVGIADWTARKHTMWLVQAGVIERIESGNAHSFRFNAKTLTKSAQESVSRLEMAVSAMVARQRDR